ncbi:MAG: tetratricopeptide repeat protein [Bryobacteraceae bacterium]|nr:tetratricopeptide repeat protein [Bryobacteraceae bacterium]
MPEQICSGCGRQQAADRVRCEDCGRPLPRVRLGERFQDRFLASGLLEERPNVFVYSGRLESREEPWILREFFPSRRPDREAFRRAAPVAAILEEGRPGLPRLYEWFECDGCIYAIEPPPPGPNLARLTAEGRLDETMAARLFWQTVKLLEGFGSEPAIYHGAIRPTDITVSDDGTVTELSGPVVLFDVIDSLRPPAAGDSLGRDLPATGFAVLSTLSGNSNGSLSSDPEAREKALSSMTGKDLAMALEWVTSFNGRPPSFAALRDLRDRLRGARAEWQKENWAQARAGLNAVRQLRPSPLIDALIEKLDREQAARRPKPAPAEPAGPAPVTEPAPAPQAPPAPPVDAKKPPAGPPARPAVEPVRPNPAKTLLRLILVAAFCLTAFIVWRVFYPDISAFERAIGEGRLLGESRSAYALYRAESASSRAAAKMRKVAQPLLASYSEQTFQDWRQNSELKDTSWEQCAQAHEWLTEIEPENTLAAARYHYARARVAMEAKQYNQAIERLQAALSIRPNWDLAVLGIGIAHVRMKDPTAAERYYQDTIRISPDWVFPRMNLAELYLIQGRLAEAETQAREALRCDSERPTVVELYGRVLYFRDKYGEACRVLGRALDLARNAVTRLDLSLLERRRRTSCERANR